MVILLVIITVIIGISSYYLWEWIYWRRRGIPGPLGYPILGNALTMLNSQNPPFLQLKKWTKQYGNVYGITEGLMKSLVISDPELVQEVFVKQYDNFHGRKLNSVQGDPNKDKIINMFSAQGHRWKRLRSISNPTFSSNNLRKLKTTVEDCTMELLRHIEQQTAGGNPIDLLIFHREFTMDAISRITIGQTDSQMFKNPFFKPVRGVVGAPQKSFFLPGMIAPWTGPYLRKILFSFPQFFKNPAVNIIRQAAEAVKSRQAQRVADENDGIEPGEPQDIIDLFLDAKSDDVEYENTEDFSKTGVKVTKQLTTDEIAAQCFVFLIAGSDTTALSLSYASYLLATHPEIQKKLQEEVDKECPDPEITFDQISKLKYAECVMKEALRLYPLGTLVNSRRCMRATKIGDYEIEEGVNVICDTWTLHSDKNIWGEDADEFKPERWDTGDDHFFPKGAYIPFGLGPRQCIGMRFAFMEQRLLMSHILKKYTIETCSKTQIPLKLVGSKATNPESVWVHLKMRDDIS